MAISSWKKILYCLAIILSAIYLIWRIGWTIPWEQRFRSFCMPSFFGSVKLSPT